MLRQRRYYKRDMHSYIIVPLLDIKILGIHVSIKKEKIREEIIITVLFFCSVLSLLMDLRCQS
jgi:hypothetical protein